MRLLFYYPDETAEVISERLLSFDVSDGDYVEQCVKNGVVAEEFIYAAGWSTDERVRSALQSLADKAMQPEVIEALQRVDKRRAAGMK